MVVYCIFILFFFLIFGCDQFPEHPYGDLSSKVTLKKHNKDDTLSPLEDSDEIEDGCLVEIVLKGEKIQFIFNVNNPTGSMLRISFTQNTHKSHATLCHG